MPKPGEHKTVQVRILSYAQEIGWTFVPRAQAERRRGFETSGAYEDRARHASLFFDDLLFQKVREFNPKYKEAEGALLGQFRHLRPNINGSRDFIGYLRNTGTYFDDEENRELDLKLIDYEDAEQNVYEVTEEFAWHNGRYGNREDVVFLINGLPVLVIECKNANKDEAIALGIEQIRRYHDETPEFFVPEQIFVVTEAIGFCYGVTWNTVRRNVFNWKAEDVGSLESKIKTFCDTPQVLKLIKDYIVFAEKDEELRKYILHQHQTAAVERVVGRAHDPTKNRGLIWHTQGSGKTFTMIKAAELLFKAPESEKPTILMMIDRNELEDQMLNYVDREFQRKTGTLVRDHVDTWGVNKVTEFFEIGPETIELIKNKEGSDNTKVINLIKSIEKIAEEQSEDPYLIAMAERAKAIQESFESRQRSTLDALEDLYREVEQNEARKKEQAEKGFDGLTFFVYRTLLDAGLDEAEETSERVKAAFVENPNWQHSEKELRELRKKVTFAICAVESDLDKATSIVEQLFTLLAKAYKIDEG